MSATNHTTTIGLSQYISTDKPTYLSDYNGDMLAIDNAIAADRDSISTAQNKADTADGKADTNKGSIDTLNAQINGNPSDPSDTGMAGKVNAIDGSVNTINSLIGNGSPTTSDQTIIGAVNGLEASLAPREDGPTLTQSYAENEQFARGALLYTALTALTAGTAFNTLVLNTDYKQSPSIVEQIAGDTPIDKVGDLEDLDTTDKSSVVAAINEVVGEIPSAGAVELQTGTLTAGQTSVVLTFAEQTIGATSLIDVYVEDGLLYDAIATTSTTITLTFAAQASNVAVAARVTN